ncbi:uncharacterized protein ACO6RY_00619 [Pungitius sinensis]
MDPIPSGGQRAAGGHTRRLLPCAHVTTPSPACRCGDVLGAAGSSAGLRSVRQDDHLESRRGIYLPRHVEEAEDCAAGRATRCTA